MLMDKSLVRSTKKIIFSFLVSAPKKENIVMHSMITFLWNSEFYFQWKKKNSVKVGIIIWEVKLAITCKMNNEFDFH